MPRFNTKEIANYLQVVAKAAAKKSPIEAIEGVMFKGDGEIITMGATDLCLTIQAQVTVPHLEEFDVILPAKTVNLISSLPGEQFDLLIDEA